ncbi:MAG TPA: hypothetical protein VKI45_07050 [Allosphingosinicella sp.]|nr:hypothetical protein [Allosphingosinicella sp.]
MFLSLKRTQVAIAAAFLGSAYPATIAAAPVTILNAQMAAEDSNPGAAAATRIVVGPYRTRAVVFVTAWGDSSYNGPGANSGILVSIVDGDRPLARDDSFQEPSSSMNYRASASSNFVLNPGERRIISARTDPYGQQSAGNKGTSVHMTLIALQAQ